ncbi:helix-turn-helix domain-containing protein [Streptomyces sp. H27-D2]|uniref:helix-turn-helix domain-containing protein n=1 Tax=Streptomyces sp. H27-D2 TaxID=3046304 RepID=UPI002DBAB5C9|nr:helix-turn-helix domain-containing protein [Streptomyces sp. H27-D2]MEC4020739.1 helix-turn-helix domain-containing protein [Streptomyces sp. H27-D2]
MILLDAVRVPPADRVGALDAAMIGASVPCRVTHEDSAGVVRARMDVWPFGGSTLFSAASTGLRLVRTARHVRMEGPPIVVIAQRTRGHGMFAQSGREEPVGAGDRMLNDLTAPYEFGWTGTGASESFQVSYDVLGLPVDIVRRGAGRLKSSPLHDLVRGHLAYLSRHADTLSADPGAAALGSATVELLRALITSAAQADTRPVMAETLLSGVLAYTRLHLTEPGLTPAGIAGAHSISVRYLYRTCAEAEISLEQWITTQRLEGARRTLSSEAGRTRPIASVARARGFSDASHFARRFREAYGVTPREWRRAAGGAGSGRASAR